MEVVLALVLVVELLSEWRWHDGGGEWNRGGEEEEAVYEIIAVVVMMATKMVVVKKAEDVLVKWRYKRMFWWWSFLDRGRGVGKWRLPSAKGGGRRSRMACTAGRSAALAAPMAEWPPVRR